MTAPQTFPWNDNYALGYPPMDDTHREFVTVVDGLMSADPTGLPAAIAAVVAHLEAHFAQEAEWMNGTDFPAAGCHIDEHDAVLKSAHQVQALLADGVTPEKAAKAKSFGQALVDWFPGHADYLDSALSQWMVKRVYGGAPIVLHRDVKPSNVPNAEA